MAVTDEFILSYCVTSSVNAMAVNIIIRDTCYIFRKHVIWMNILLMYDMQQVMVVFPVLALYVTGLQRDLLALIQAPLLNVFVFDT